MLTDVAITMFRSLVARANLNARKRLEATIAASADGGRARLLRIADVLETVTKAARAGADIAAAVTAVAALDIIDADAALIRRTIKSGRIDIVGELGPEYRVVNRSPVRVDERYLTELYNEHRIEFASELIADTTWRHTPGGVKMLTMGDTIERLQAFLDKYPDIHFANSVTIVDGKRVTAVWNGMLTTRSGRKVDVAGIEVFRVVDGKIVEVWNQDLPGCSGLWQKSPVH